MFVVVTGEKLVAHLHPLNEVTYSANKEAIVS